jgi:hypothetical protein
MDEFTAALEGGSWSAILGLALLMLAPVANTYVVGKISPAAERWVSLARGIALGIGPMLAVGGTWWIAVVTGTVGLVQSAGFPDLVRAVIPDYKGEVK